MIDQPRGAVLELAHALVDEADEIGEPVGHRRIDGVAGRLGIAPLDREAVARPPLVLRVVALGDRNELAEDDDLLLDAGTAAEEDVDRFLEIEQPERQLEIARIEHLRAVAEAAPVLVVPVEQEDAQVGARLQDLLQEQRDAARLADAGRAEHGEMLAQHFVDVDAGVDRRVLLQVPDGDRVGAGHVVDEPQLLVGEEGGRIADRRIVGDAALEVRRAGRVLLDLAHHVEVGGRDEALFDGDRRRFQRDLGDHADEQRPPALDAQELADRDATVVGIFEARGRQPDAGLGALNRQHISGQVFHGDLSAPISTDLMNVQRRLPFWAQIWRPSRRRFPVRNLVPAPSRLG